ncbi:MAG: hypothetical protein AB8U40_01175 [Anaplasma ovis]
MFFIFNMQPVLLGELSAKLAVLDPALSSVKVIEEYSERVVWCSSVVMWLRLLRSLTTCLAT